jgi:hypothetical protein
MTEEQKPKHTWRAEEHEDEILILAEDDIHIATVVGRVSERGAKIVERGKLIARAPELEVENQRLREALGKIPEGAKWFTFEMFREQLMDFALAYHKSTQKDIANDSAEWAYEIFDKDDSAALSSPNQK